MRTAQNSQKIMTTKITVTALLTAVAIALQYIEVPIPLVPSFLKLDFSDLPELIGAFVLGPQYGIIICLLKNLIHLPVSSSMFVGEFSNFILGAIFVFVAFGLSNLGNYVATIKIVAGIILFLLIFSVILLI